MTCFLYTRIQYSYVHSLDTCNLFLNERICSHHAKVPVSRCNKIIIVRLRIPMIRNSERRRNQTLRIVNSVQPDQIIWRQSGSIRPFRLNTKICEYERGLTYLAGEENKSYTRPRSEDGLGFFLRYRQRRWQTNAQ